MLIGIKLYPITSQAEVLLKWSSPLIEHTKKKKKKKCYMFYRYGELERPGLLSSLSQLDISDTSDTAESEKLEDKVLCLTQAAGRVSEVASACAARCSKLTQNCGTAGLIEAIQVIYRSILMLYIAFI
jgi:hypothetical protein